MIRQKFVPLFLSLLFFILLLEAVAWTYFRVFPERFTFMTGLKDFVIKDDEIPKLMKTFSPQLGWDSPGPRGQNVFSEDAIAVFGDSFVRGDEIEDKETWAFYLSQKLKKNVLNYGVGGYGPDQAFLKFLSLSSTLKAPVVILCLTSEIVNRTMNIYRPFYFPGSGLRLPKPRFVETNEGFELESNLINSVDEIDLLRDENFLKKIAEKDFWYKNEIPIDEFPRIRAFFKESFWEEIFHGKRNDVDPKLTPIWEHPPAARIVSHIINKFISETDARGKKGFIIFLPRRHDIERLRNNLPLPFANFMRNLPEASRNKILNFSLTIFQRTKDKDLDLYWMKHGHPSPLLTRMIAEELATQIQ